MHQFKDIAALFEAQFKEVTFPASPTSLYDPCRSTISLGGKRIRPVSLLMANEMFAGLSEDAYHAAKAIELFHNFSLIHDDIMDKAPLRRGLPTVAASHGENTALLAGDVMLIRAYDALNLISASYLSQAISLFNITARQVCEGQQLDMEFEKRSDVSLKEYVHMISMKTSVLLAASLQLGAMLAGASQHNQDLIYAFGKNLGIAFQIQDDYLDAFGDPAKFGKQVGGDILANKKTFLLIHALESANESQSKEIHLLLSGDMLNKVERMLRVYKDCGVDDWAHQLKESYAVKALQSLEEIACSSNRKKPLEELAAYLLQRDY